MLTLYYKPTCPFCQRVLEMAENLKVDFDLQDISDDDATREALIAHGGKQQVPYLVDTEREVAMYESSDIIDYIREHYANTGGADTTSSSRVHVSDAVCESCEG